MSSCRWEKEVFDDWMKGVDEACSFNLSQPLLSRNEETKLISVNFDPQVGVGTGESGLLGPVFLVYFSFVLLFS